MTVEDVTFYSEGTKMWGRLHLPDDRRPDARHACVINLAGFAGTYEYKGTSGDLGARLARAGYAGFGFDYRGFGRSEGKHRLVHPLMQVRDVRNAISYLQTRPEVDGGRIALWGRSFGAAIAAYTGPIDERVGAVVAYAGIGDGYRWLRNLIPLPDWQDLMKEAAEDRERRASTNAAPQAVSSWQLVRKRQADYLADSVDEETKGNIGGEILLQSAEAVAEFAPESVLHRMAPRPILFIHAESDSSVPASESVSMYERCGEPKALWLLPESYSKGHYGLFQGQNVDSDETPWARFTRPIIGWLHEHFPVDLPDRSVPGVVRGSFSGAGPR